MQNYICLFTKANPRDIVLQNRKRVRMQLVISEQEKQNIKKEIEGEINAELLKILCVQI